MKHFEQKYILLALVLLLSILLLACGQNDSDFAKALDKIKTYQFGDSRVALSKIESLVLETTNKEQKNRMASDLAEILNNDVSFAAKQFICQQLRVIGNEEQIPLLQQLLLNEEYSEIALFALALMPSPRVNEVFRDAITKLDGKYQISIINALGERRDKNAVNDLSPLLSDPDPLVVDASGLSLGKIGTAEAGSKLKKILDTKGKNNRTNMLKYYLMCAQNLHLDGEKEAALEIFRELSGKDVVLQIQMQARHVLVSEGEFDAAIFVSEAIESEDRIVRHLAMQTIKDTPGEEATSKFCKIIEGQSAENQEILIFALSDRGDSGALQTMVQALNHKNENVRIAALQSIAILGDEMVVPMLLQQIIKTNGRENEAARNSLYRLRGSEVDKRISENINVNDNKVRIEVIRALSARNYMEGTSILLNLLYDADELIRIESWNGLAELGTDKDLSQMITAWVKTDSDSETQVAEDAVVKICRNATTRHKYISEIAAEMGKKQSKDIKISLINALGRIGANESLPMLQDLLYDKDSDVQTAAIRSLSLWPTDGPLEDLRHVVTTTRDEIQKVIALRGYIYMIGLATNREISKTLELYNDAMNLSWRAEEKRLVLTGYSHLQSFDALKEVEKYLLDKELENESAAAALAICDELISRTTNRAERGRISLILDMIIQTSVVESIISEAKRLATRMEE